MVGLLETRVVENKESQWDHERNAYQPPMGMFRLEFCLPFQESIHGGEEILQVFLILPHQVFGPLQEFFRSCIAECHR